MSNKLLTVHALLLLVAAAAILIAPVEFLMSLGVDPAFPEPGAADVTGADFAVLSLARVIAALLIALSAAGFALRYIPPDLKVRGCLVLGVGYYLAGVLLLIQQAAIWTSLAGLLIALSVLVLSAVFVLGGRQEAASTETVV